MLHEQALETANTSLFQTDESAERAVRTGNSDQASDCYQILLVRASNLWCLTMELVVRLNFSRGGWNLFAIENSVANVGREEVG
jgi:hypothetical protein